MLESERQFNVVAHTRMAGGRINAAINNAAHPARLLVCLWEPRSRQCAASRKSRKSSEMARINWLETSCGEWQGMCFQPQGASRYTASPRIKIKL